jgi:hypothetical protein
MEPNTGKRAEAPKAESAAGRVCRASIVIDRWAVSVIETVREIARLVIPDLLWPVVIPIASMLLSDAAEQRLPRSLFLRMHALLAVLMFLASASAAA